MRRRSACLVAAVAAANALRSSFTATPPPCDPRTGAALLPFDRQGATSWEGARRRFLIRRPRAPDPGRPEALDWLDADLEGVEAIYDADGVVVREANATGGAWRLLCTSGTVVQSAALLVDAKIHGGCLAGYTRGLGAAAFACTTSQSALVLGLGFGCVAAFLAAHGPHAVTAVEVDPAVVAAAARCAPLPANVDVILADAVDFLRTCDDGAYDVVVIDVFDAESRLPAALSAPAFAEDVARVARRGVAANLVRETSLDTEAGCERLARNLGDATVRRGGDCFLAPDPRTDNAQLLALFGGGAAPRACAGARRGAAGAPACSSTAAPRCPSCAARRGARSWRGSGRGRRRSGLAFPRYQGTLPYISTVPVPLGKSCDTCKKTQKPDFSARHRPEPCAPQHRLPAWPTCPCPRRSATASSGSCWPRPTTGRASTARSASPSGRRRRSASSSASTARAASAAWARTSRSCGASTWTRGRAASSRP